MEKRVVLLFTCLFICLSLTFAQDIPGGVVAAFKKGNSQELGKYLSNKVDLIIQNKSVGTDNRRVEGAMKEFFSTNRVSSFDVKHKGKRDESSFIVGILATSNGGFRVNCFFKKVQDKYVINQIRIDKTNE